MASEHYIVLLSTTFFSENKYQLNPQDRIGFISLEVIAKADLFNKWMFESIEEFAKGNILEIGSGIGNISRFFIQKNFQITLSDVDDFYLNTLRNQFSHSANVQDFVKVDLQDTTFEKNYGSLREKFDTVFYLNVLEHLQDDGLAIRNSLFMLKPGGFLIILVPAYSFLYSRMDKALNHYRRYNRKRLNALLSNHGMPVKKSFYFNAAGIGAWLYAKATQLETVPEKEMKSFNKIVPLAKMLDKILLHKIGLSVVSIAQK